MIICDYFVKIYKNYSNLWVINGALINKNIFNTNRVVYSVMGGRGGRGGIKNNKTKKIRNFMTKEIIGYSNYRVKIYK